MHSSVNIRHKAVIVMLIIACLMMCSQSISAQRTANRQSMVSVSAVSSLLRPQEVGAEVSYGQYLLEG